MSADQRAEPLAAPPPRPVISASRRSDVPAFHADWLRARLEAGWCEVRQPFGGGIRRVELGPEAVRALVLWTRDPRPLVPHLPWIARRGYPFVFSVTVCDYPPFLEPGAPPVDAVVDALAALGARFGADTLVWRYDPIVLTTATPPAWHRERFAALAARLAGVTDECVVSLVDLYRKTLRNLDPALERAGVERLGDDPARDAALLEALASTASRHGIRLTLCCEPAQLRDGLPAARCVDDRRLARLVGAPLSLPSRPTRAGCGCRASVDIGAYDTCPRGCVYCYANRSPRAGRDGAARVEPGSPRLGGAAAPATSG